MLIFLRATHKQGLPNEAVGFVGERVAQQKDAGGGEAVARGGQETGQRLANGVAVRNAVLDEKTLAQHGQTQFHQLQETDPRHNESEVDAGAHATTADPDAQRLAHSTSSNRSHGLFATDPGILRY